MTLNQTFKLDEIEFNKLDPLQRVLLVNDGTLTTILEAYFLENILVKKISEKVTNQLGSHSALELKGGEKLIVREILLQGEKSEKYFIYAKTLVVIERIDEEIRNDLLNSKTPIGRIWKENKKELFKEILYYKVEAAGQLAPFFNIDFHDNLLTRSFVVYSHNKPNTFITEKFPNTLFNRMV